MKDLHDQVTKDGGPAFPNDKPPAAMVGMSLRDWFAGQALKSLILLSDNPKNTIDAGSDEESLASFAAVNGWGSDTNCGDGAGKKIRAVDHLVLDAYFFADAMLAEREKQS